MAHNHNQGPVYNQAGGNINIGTLFSPRKVSYPDARLEHQHIHPSDKPDSLLELNAAPGAAFNALGKDHDPQCLHNTRVQILQQIRTWADGEDGRHIFWLSGWAGTGKSTIARTIAREYFDKGRFMASFFFSRGDADVSHARKFVGTIATQLAARCSTFESILNKTISDDRGIFGRTLKDQWNGLVLQPLSKLRAESFQAPLLIVIDALDECERESGRESDISLVLQLLRDLRCFSQLHSRVFITSRPELPVRHEFPLVPDQDHQDFVLHDISRSTVDNDIFLFLQHTLADIQRKRQLGQNWPGEEATKQLVRQAAGLFIWAATASRFISGGNQLTTKRLSLVLQASAPTTKPEEELDKIYTMVLKNSVGDDLGQQEKEEVYCLLRKTLGAIVILFSPLSPTSLANLLHSNKGDVEQTLVDFHSILDVPQDPSRPVRLHHPSLRDFLLSPQRCSNEHFQVEEEKAHKTMASHCIQLMSDKLQRDICGLGNPGVKVAQVPPKKLERFLPAELQYACRYWIDHLQRSKYQLCDGGEVHCFLRNHLLHWTEALSLCKSMSEGVASMAKLETFIQVILGSIIQCIIHAKKT